MQPTAHVMRALFVGDKRIRSRLRMHMLAPHLMGSVIVRGCRMGMPHHHQFAVQEAQQRLAQAEDQEYEHCRFPSITIKPTPSIDQASSYAIPSFQQLLQSRTFDTSITKCYTP